MANRPTEKTAEQERLEDTKRNEQANALPEGRTIADIENEQRQYIKDPNPGTPNTVDPNAKALQDLVNERVEDNRANAESEEEKKAAAEHEIIERNRTGNVDE